VYQAVKDVSASYDALVDLFESIENFLSRLEIYTKIPLTPPMADIIVKIMVEVLSTLALATKQVRQGMLSGFFPCRCGSLTKLSTVKFVKKLLGENEIEVVLQQLDRLTLDEVRTIGVHTLKVMYDLVQHLRAIVGCKNTVVGLSLVRS